MGVLCGKRHVKYVKYGIGLIKAHKLGLKKFDWKNKMGEKLNL
jgi:hypothetical protein